MLESTHGRDRKPHPELDIIDFVSVRKGEIEARARIVTTFRQLEALVAVVDMGSFEGAARALSTSQSAASRLVKELEGEFRTALYNRERRSARLTVEGQEVLRLARTILRERGKLIERFASRELVSPLLRMGVTEHNLQSCT